ncbi:MAG: hypothetical protein AABY01_00415 [Nanoarchaeota archaeon]
MDTSRHEELRLKQVQRNAERDAALQAKNSAHASRRKKIYWTSGIVLTLVLLIAGIAFAMPGRLDSFAKCLSEKDAVMYGAIEWCSYTQDQAGMFGKSFKFITYEDHTNGPNIKKTPTWQINGQMYENVQSLERLSALTGCPL